jgi:two-component system, OmpR family, response regulator
LRLLIVDDELRFAAHLKRGLEGEGFAVDVAHTGPDGLWMATEQSYDAVVLDIMLPGMNGYRVCEELRRAGNWVPVLMLTAKNGEYDEAEALDTGADDYLSKPFSFVVLVARLRALLRRGSPERPVVLQVGNLTLDPSSRRVKHGGIDIELTPTEFALLDYLMRHPDEVLSKSDILGHVWDFGFDGAPNIVEVYVGYLRRKLAVEGGSAEIATVRGAGYRLCAAEGSGV